MILSGAELEVMFLSITSDFQMALQSQLHSYLPT